MTDIPMVTYWCGQDIREMSREDLEAAFLQLGEMYRKAVEEAASLRKDSIWVVPPELRRRSTS